MVLIVMIGPSATKNVIASDKVAGVASTKLATTDKSSRSTTMMMVSIALTTRVATIAKSLMPTRVRIIKEELRSPVVVAASELISTTETTRVLPK